MAQSDSSNWFGKLDLAYKYSIVFGSLLLLTILAGCVKVWYNHRRLKKHTQEAKDVEAAKDDQMELNQREKDEGDLFGIRAIEAGFYAGIPQSGPPSRAASRAGSFMENQARSTSTLIGGATLALKDHQNTHSMSSSVTTLPLAHTNDRETSVSPPLRKGPPAIKLAPSEAELNGRINHNAAVNMKLNVPPSPTGQGPSSPTLSDSGSDQSLSSRSATFRPDYYAPQAPQIPMPRGLTVTVHSAEEVPQSEAASFNESAPSTRGPTPEIKLPGIPTKALRDEPRSLFPAEQSKLEPERPSSPVRLLPQTYQPTHTHSREMSDASSVYSSHNRMSTRMSTHMSNNSTDSSYNFSLPKHANRNSVALSATKEGEPNAAGSLLAPSLARGSQTNDPRFSEFYEAYYRNSQLGPISSTDGAKRPNQLNIAQDTIAEVESPLPSPNPQTWSKPPGVAM